MFDKEFSFFLQVCKDGSIRKAAKSLYISPQGLGKALLRLEQDLGIQLFERGKDGIHLTEYGKVIKPYAQNIVDTAFAIKQSISKLNEQVSGVLNVACSLGVIGALTPSLFMDFQTMFPSTELNIFEGTDQKVQNMVTSIDNFMGISVGPLNRNDLDEIFLTSNRLVWLVNKNNPLTQKDTIEFSDLENEPLIMYSEEFEAYHKVFNCCKREGFSPNIICSINEAIMAYKFCIKYKALALTVDFIAEDVITEEIVIKPILDKDCLWDLYLITPKQSKRSDVQQAFINYITQTISTG